MSCSISVLMPVYNAELYLREAIDSILNQTFPDFELIIIDDCSTDDSLNIINSYRDPRISLVKNEENIGVVGSLNKGLTLCNGEFIARMDADDIAVSERFQLQMKHFEENPNCVVLGGQILQIDKDGKPLRKKTFPNEHNDIVRGMLVSNQIAHPTVMIRRDVMNDFCYSEEQLYVEDYFLWSILCFEGELNNLSDVLLHYRVHSEQISSSKFALQTRNALAAKTRFREHLHSAIDLESLTLLVLNEGILFQSIKSLFATLNASEMRDATISRFLWRACCKASNLGLVVYNETRKYNLNISLSKKLILFSLCVLHKGK